MRMMGMALRVVRTDGVLALYNGLSASLCRQVGAARWVLPGWCPHCRAGQWGPAGRPPSPPDDVLSDSLRHL